MSHRHRQDNVNASLGSCVLWLLAGTLGFGLVIIALGMLAAEAWQKYS